MLPQNALKIFSLEKTLEYPFRIYIKIIFFLGALNIENPAWFFKKKNWVPETQEPFSSV